MSETFEVRDRRGGFLWVPNDVFDQYAKQLHPITFMVYLAFCRLANNEDQTCHPSKTKIMTMVNTSARTVTGSIQELISVGLISSRQTGRANVYTLLPAKQPTARQDAPDKQPTACLPSNLVHYNKTKEQDLILSTEDQSPESPDLVLIPDCPKKKSKAADERYPAFFEKLKKFYKYINGGKDLYWTPADSKQLAEFLKHWPELKLEDFHFALENYMNSENVIPSRTPKQFLPSLNLYFDSALDKYNKPITDDKRTVH